MQLCFKLASDLAMPNVRAEWHISVFLTRGKRKEEREMEISSHLHSVKTISPADQYFLVHTEKSSFVLRL